MEKPCIPDKIAVIWTTQFEQEIEQIHFSFLQYHSLIDKGDILGDSDPIFHSSEMLNEKFEIDIWDLEKHKINQSINQGVEKEYEPFFSA